ncbi:hypothetical protein M5689_020143 [Euphorbia peplus]|nr:hypothetical protein M5689_020143 [Euphorbia peplus]
MISCSPSPSPQWMLHRTTSPSSSSSFRLSCRALSPQSPHLKFALHKALDSAGIDTSHAKDSRKRFVAEIDKFTAIERETSITINKRVDLWKTALYIAAEDDSLVSYQSSDRLPVDYFVTELYNLSMNFCTEYSSSLTRSSPEEFLQSLERFLYVNKGFRRSNGEENQIDPAALYLHSVLMEGCGSAAMLSLIYSETLKVLRMWSFLDFDCEILFPVDRFGLPSGYHKQKMKDSDQEHILTTQTLLHKILRNMKERFWPFQHDYSKSSFLRAADAVNSIRRSTSEESGIGRAAATATRNRLVCGASTNVHYGDMRLALSACERLILLESDPKELRDYSILLYHCGFYDLSLQYLKLYKEREQICSLQRQTTSNDVSHPEEDAVEKLMTRLTFISMEEGWSKPSYSRNCLQNNIEVSW